MNQRFKISKIVIPKPTFSGPFREEMVALPELAQDEGPMYDTLVRHTRQEVMLLPGVREIPDGYDDLENYLVANAAYDSIPQPTGQTKQVTYVRYDERFPMETEVPEAQDAPYLPLAYDSVTFPSAYDPLTLTVPPTAIQIVSQGPYDEIDEIKVVRLPTSYDLLPPSTYDLLNQQADNSQVRTIQEEV